MIQCESYVLICESVSNEAVKNLIMSWYYAGYYTGLYEGQQSSASQVDPEQTKATENR